MRFDLGINAMTKNVIKNINLIVNGNGKQYRSFVHVRDAAKTILFFINKKSPKIKYSIFNVGSNSLNIRIIDLANKIKKKFKKIKIFFNKDQADFRSYRADFSRLNKIDREGQQHGKSLKIPYIRFRLEKQKKLI